MIRNTRSGQDIIFIQTAKDTNGKLLEMEASWRPGSVPPPMHYHPYQLEEFMVLEGELSVKMDGKVKSAPVARVVYSRPQKLGREIFGGIVAYDKVWRMGANEATEIEFFKNVKIGSKTLDKGRYTMYGICTDTMWTIIFNTEKDVWGLYYNPKKDVLRVNEPVQKNDEPVEALTMYFEDTTGGTKLNILWDTTKVSLPINF